MRKRKVKLPLTLDALRLLLTGRRPFTIGELALSFEEDVKEVEEMLWIGVARGAIRFYPASRNISACFGIIEEWKEGAAAPREAPDLTSELRYDLFSHARVAQATRRS